MKKKYNGITGLRGLTACAIAYVFHYLILFKVMPVDNPAVERIIAAIAYMTLSASDVFFVMSGFLMAKKYSGRVIEHFDDYIVPKIKKIFPLMISTAIFVFALENIGLKLFGDYPLHADGGDVRYSLTALILNLLGLQTGFIADGDTYAVNGPSWFVSVIFICQILFYVVERCIKKQKYQNCIFVVMFVIGLVCIIVPIEFPLMYSCVGRGYVGYFSGVLMWRVTSRIYDMKQDYYIFFKEGSAIIAYLLAALFAYISLKNKNSGVTSETYIILLAFWICMTFIVVYGSISSRFFGFKPFVWLGERAMVIFLCNIPTDLLLVFIDKYFELNKNYGATDVWLVHIIISLVVVSVVYMLDMRVVQPLIKGK